MWYRIYIGSGDSAVCPQHRPSSQTVFSCDRARRRPASDKGQSNRVLTEGGEFPLSLVVGLSVIVFLCGFRSRKQHARGDFRRQKRQASKASAEQYKNRRFASTKSTVPKNGASRRGAVLIFLCFVSKKCSRTAFPSLFIWQHRTTCHCPPRSKSGSCSWCVMPQGHRRGFRRKRSVSSLY